ncbi:hypothetical protein [Sphingomonas sp. OTU376]|uniref:hypothetical protein n=1 Tax=Sphingomonas sp. OTU376 TaxID=3043863 RepID=UPI00313C7AC9
MSKVLKTAAIVVSVVALTLAIPGAGTAIGLSAAATATAASVATIAAAGLSLAARLTTKPPSAQATGSQTSFSADPDAGLPYVVGRTGSAGNIVLRKGFNTSDAGDNDRQSFVSVLSIGPVKSVGGFTADRTAVSFNGVGQAIGTFAGFMWMTTQLGLLPQPAALGFGTGAGTPPGWSAAHKLSGLAAAAWTLRFDTKAKLYQNGVPAPMWVVEGGLCYDPRKDSTYPGGSGPHRMADPADTAAYDAAVATWEYSEDPYLHGLKWVHGIWQRDRNDPTSKYQRVMGMGAPWAGIDVASFVDGANIAQANGWKVGGVIFSGDNKWDSLKKLLQAGMGEPLALGAKISCLVNAPKVSLATITIDDVVGEASVAATQPRRARINTVTPRYRLEANNWQLLPGPPISVPEYVAADRGKRSKVLDYAFIQDANQVATAVRYDIENAREFGPIVLPLKLFWMGFKPGDCVTAQLPEMGLNGQTILLLNRDLDPGSGIATMTARSETPGKHPFALGQTTTPPSTPALSGPPLVPVPGAAAWDISETGLTKDGVTFPALVVTGAVDAGSAESVVFEYRRFVNGQAADANWSVAGVEPVTTARKEIAGVLPSTAYEVAVSYRSRGVLGGRRILGPEVTTADTAADNASAALDLAEAAQDLASGKSTIFYQVSPPTAAESAENDRWVDTDAGNFEYRRLPGSGRLSIGGTVFTFGGAAIVYPPWAPAPDQRIAQALTDAAGAQATADGKVATFNQEATPTAESFGDLWYQPSTQSLKRWNGASWSEVATVGATPAQIAQITQALSDAANAQATADGKIDSFYQPGAPAVFGEGDLWTDTDDGNKLYRASANSAAGGAWVLVRDTGIAAAIAAAAGAQGTADGKVTTFTGAGVPAATAVGDLWYNGTTGVLARWNGADWISTADNTALVQPSVTGPTPLSFNANYLGVLDAGAVPKDFPYKRLQGSTDVTTATAWSIVAADGVTLTIGAGDGVANITAVSKDSASFTIRSTYNGVTRDFPVIVQRSRAAAPVNTGSTGNPGTSGSVNASASSTSTRYGGADSASFTCVAGSAGQVALSTSLTVSLYAPSGVYSQSGYAKPQWRVPGGSWADVGSEYLSNGSASYDKTNGPTDTTLDVNVTKTGLTAGSTYEFRLTFRKASGTSGQTMSFSGTFAGTGS